MLCQRKERRDEQAFRPIKKPSWQAMMSRQEVPVPRIRGRSSYVRGAQNLESLKEVGLIIVKLEIVRSVQGWKQAVLAALLTAKPHFAGICYRRSPRVANPLHFCKQFTDGSCVSRI